MNGNMINHIEGVISATEGQWLSGGGECCGFDSFVEGDYLHCVNRVCGIGETWEGYIHMDKVRSVAKSIHIDDLVFDEWGECLCLIEQNVYFYFDKSEGISFFDLKMG